MTLRSIALGALAATAMLAATGAATAANLVVNGSFNNPAATSKVGFQGNTPGWSGGANLTFLATPGSADDTSQYLAVYGPFPATSPDGGQFVLADGDPNYSGAFSQTISNLTVGHNYTLTFYQAAGQQYGFTGPTTEQWSVSFGAQTQLSSLFSLPQAGVGPWTKQTMVFTAGSTSQVLSFLAKGTPGGAPPISFLDGVNMQGVPEPASWALMLVGFASIGAMVRRRRVTNAFA